MDRYKLKDADIKKAVTYLKTKKGTLPVWASKYKDDLTLKGNKLFYKERQVVSRERVDDVLRNELYKKGGDVPSGRDSAFHICKQRYVGISRRALMEFIRKQKPLGEVKAALNKPKRTSGERLKNYTFESDLIFLKKTDLEKANKKFIRDDTNELTYFLSTVEKVTGLCRFDHVLNKDASIVTPLVIKHCEDIAKQLKTKIKQCDIRTDKGGEFKLSELAKAFKHAKFVNSGVSVENKNASFQKCFFQILRQRKATDIDDAMRQSEKLLNNTYNRIHKATSNELVERADAKKDLQEYNNERKTYIAGDRRKPFDIGQHVRLLVKEAKQGIDYKRYKNITYSQQVYVITKVTKRTTPKKYWVNHKWRLQSELLKSAPRDELSVSLVKERDNAQTTKAKEERKEHIAKRFDEIQKEKTDATKNKDKPKLRRSSRAGAQTAKINMLWSKGKYQKVDDTLDAIENKEEESKQLRMKKQLEASKKKLEESKKKSEKNRIKRPVKTPQHKAMIRFLTRYGLPSGGTQEVLSKRIIAFKKSNKDWKKKRITVKKV